MQFWQMSSELHTEFKFPHDFPILMHIENEFYWRYPGITVIPERTKMYLLSNEEGDGLLLR